MRNIKKKSWLFSIPRWLFRNLRGQSKDRGGARELSSGVLSDVTREKLVEEARSYEGDLVEIGSGEGLFIKEVIKRAERYKMVGLELQQWMIKRAMQNLGNEACLVRFVQGDGTAIPFKDASFNTAVCVNIFYNIPTMSIVEAIIKEVGRVLKKGGIFIFEIRNKYNPLMYALYRWVHTYDTSIGQLPLNTYFYHEIKRLLEEHNLKVIKRRGVVIPLWYLSPVFIIVARRKG